MYITELDRPWLETPFLFQGFELKTEEEIQAVRDICEYVYVDMTKRKKRINSIVSRTQTNIHSILNYGSPPKKIKCF